MLVPQGKNKTEKRLLKILAQLSPDERKTLLDFAEFLASRTEPAKPVSLEPEAIPRPADENVVAALKRLRQTYPMLDHSSMLNDASGVMTQHMVQGMPAQEAIDQLEQMFKQEYEKFREQTEQ